MSGPDDLDRVILREHSEGGYAGMDGCAHRGLPEEVGTEVAVFTQMLDHLGDTKAAGWLMAVVETVCEAGITTPSRPCLFS